MAAMRATAGGQIFDGSEELGSFCNFNVFARYSPNLTLPAYKRTDGRPWRRGQGARLVRWHSAEKRDIPSISRGCWHAERGGYGAEMEPRDVAGGGGEKRFGVSPRWGARRGRGEAAPLPPPGFCWGGGAPRARAGGGGGRGRPPSGGG